MSKSDRDTGKTTRLFERGINLLADLPDGHIIYVTSPHTKWLFQLERQAKQEGLVGFKMLTYQAIKEGKLRGCLGVLLIDDIDDFGHNEQFVLWNEQRILEMR